MSSEQAEHVTTKLYLLFRFSHDKYPIPHFFSNEGLAKVFSDRVFCILLYIDKVTTFNFIFWFLNFEH